MPWSVEGEHLSDQEIRIHSFDTFSIRNVTGSRVYFPTTDPSSSSNRFPSVFPSRMHIQVSSDSQ